MLRQILVCSILGFIVSGCGEGYRLEPARLVLADTQDLSISELRNTIGSLLQAQGFKDFGRDDKMIDLLDRSDETGETVARLLHEYTYLSDRRNLRVVVTDYSDLARSRPTLAYEEPIGPFFEVAIYEERPGGFSSSGNQFLSEFQENLKNSLGASVTLVTPPPRTDDAEYWRITSTNVFAGIVNWLVVFGISIAITGTISRSVLKRMPIRAKAKRTIFVLVNTWLATPLPFPAASILVILLPNVLAIPWTNLDYYRRVQDVAVFSFPVTLVLCTLIAVRMFRNSDAKEGDA